MSAVYISVLSELEWIAISLTSRDFSSLATSVNKQVEEVLHQSCSACPCPGRGPGCRGSHVINEGC